MAKWLETVTVKVASANPHDEHAQCLCHVVLFFNCADRFLLYSTVCSGYIQYRVIVFAGKYVWCFHGKSRLRAAIFVNLVAMRKALSCPSNGVTALTDSNLTILQRANYLFHAAHNRPLAFDCVCGMGLCLVGPHMCFGWMLMSVPVCHFNTCHVIQGLVAESIQKGELLWKTRPKYHKLLGYSP